MASQITSVSIVYSTICSGVDQRKHSPVTGDSHRKGPVTRKMFPVDDVIMATGASSPMQETMNSADTGKYEEYYIPFY